MIRALLRETKKKKKTKRKREKEENASGDRFLLGARPRMIKSLSMVGGVIKDPRLRPYELSEKRTKRSQRVEEAEEEEKEKEDEEKSKKYCGCRAWSTEKETAASRAKKGSERNLQVGG